MDFFGVNYNGEKPGSQLIATSSKLPAKDFTTSLDESRRPLERLLIKSKDGGLGGYGTYSAP